MLTLSVVIALLQIETLFKDLGPDLGVLGYRVSSGTGYAGTGCADMETERIKPVTVPLTPKLWDGSSLSLGQLKEERLEPKAGSLDIEVVLRRRLIQHCFPCLEDVLTLLVSFQRTWKLGVEQGNEPHAPRGTRSPHIIRSGGVSPRSRRVIKPHPLRSLPPMPSVLERRQGSEGLQLHETGISSADGARLRLVEAFFHAQPTELQTTADFVVRRAVQNACEEAQSGVNGPPDLASFSKLLVTTGGTGLHPTHSDGVTSAPSFDDSSQEVFRTRDMHSSEPRLRKRSIHVKTELERKIRSKARLDAGRTSRCLAEACTLAMVPRSLPFRQGVPLSTMIIDL